MNKITSFFGSFAAAILGMDMRPALDELRSAFDWLDHPPCSHCGLTDHSHLHTDADWQNAKNLGAFHS